MGQPSRVFQQRDCCIVLSCVAATDLKRELSPSLGRARGRRCPLLLRSGELPWCFSATSEQAGHLHERLSSDCLLVLPALRPAAGAVVMLEGLLLGSSARATLRALEAVGFMHDGRSRPVDAPMAELPLSPATGPLASRADTSMKKWNAILRQV